MSEHLHVITDDNFEEKVLKNPLPVVIDFWAVWCGPCIQLEPTVDRVASQYEGKALFGKVNVDENPGIAANYGIRSIPSLLFFKNGEVSEQTVGGVSDKEITTILNKLL